MRGRKKNSYRKGGGEVLFDYRAVIVMSEKPGSDLYSRNQLFNGTKWYAQIENKDNSQMGIFLLRQEEEV